MRSFLISVFRGQKMAICESSSSNETARSCFRRHLPRAVFSNESQPVDTPHIPTFFVHDTPIFEKKTPRRRSVPAARWRMRGSTSGVDHPNSPRGVLIDANRLFGSSCGKGGYVTDRLKIGVLLSGSGTNLQAIIDAIAGGLPTDIVLVVSSRPDAYGIERARAAGIPTLVMNREKYADVLADDAQIV